MYILQSDRFYICHTANKVQVPAYMITDNRLDY